MEINNYPGVQQLSSSNKEATKIDNKLPIQPSDPSMLQEKKEVSSVEVVISEEAQALANKWNMIQEKYSGGEKYKPIGGAHADQQLAWAAECGDIEAVQLMVEYGGYEINTGPTGASVALESATYRNHHDVVSYLIGKGARLDSFFIKQLNDETGTVKNGLFERTSPELIEYLREVAYTQNQAMKTDL